MPCSTIVPTITDQVKVSRKRALSPWPWLSSVIPTSEAISAATTPRGATQLSRARSFQSRFVRAVQAATLSGRTTKITSATAAAPPQPKSSSCVRSRRAASSMNTSPISRLVSSSLNARTRWTSIDWVSPRRKPATVTASSPVSGRTASARPKQSTAQARTNTLSMSSGAASTRIARVSSRPANPPISSPAITRTTMFSSAI